MASEKKMKVPKQIAGMKVPKKVRKAGNKALALADNPAALELAAAALTAAAAALKAQGRKRGAELTPHLPARQQDGDGAGGPDGGADDAATRLGDLVKAAALEGARRLLESMAAPAEAGTGSGNAAEPGKPRRRKASGGAAGAAVPGE